MRLTVAGLSFRTAPVTLRERVAFDAQSLPRALDQLSARFDCEAVVLSTCNRIELYVGRADESFEADGELLAEFLAEFHGLPVGDVQAGLYSLRQEAGVRHLFRVVASLDSMIVGEGQIAGQVKRAYETARLQGTLGPLLNGLFQHARLVGKRVRRETGLAKGRVSVSSAAIAYVREVFDRLDDKTALVIGAGKMGELTLGQLKLLGLRRILVTNRSPERAQALARQCAGVAVPWERLDDSLCRADIVLSTTGAPEPIMTRARYESIVSRRVGGPLVILDIAVPRDFDPAIHDGDRTCLFNIDDLQRIREQVLSERCQHVAPAEAIVEAEVKRFLSAWARRRHGPVIARLTQDLEAKRTAVVQQLLGRLNGKLTEADRAYIEGAFRLLQNQFLHGPLAALTEETAEGGRHTLLEAIRKLFRLND